MERQSSVTSYIAAGVSALIGGVTLQEVALVVGIVTAFGTFAINWYYKAREDGRAQRKRDGGDY